MSAADVKQTRARDKFLSMFNEARKDEVKEQRKGLTLAHLFPKPRPVWATPAMIGTFGDAFIEHTGFENSSCLAHSYNVLNYTLYNTLREEGLDYLEGI